MDDEDDGSGIVYEAGEQVHYADVPCLKRWRELLDSDRRAVRDITRNDFVVAVTSNG